MVQIRSKDYVWCDRLVKKLEEFKEPITAPEWQQGLCMVLICSMAIVSHCLPMEVQSVPIRFAHLSEMKVSDLREILPNPEFV